ncbi:YtxH domain-containing protein [Spirosoma sp.]|uniref:YtxH domain-containing protein n=1 Tax=Spirosoma sp. TaxID=1899569 RepID=UPI003B3AB47B
MFLKTSKHPQDYLTEQSFWTGLVAGAVAGLAVGLLVAPRSGKHTRKKLADSISEHTQPIQREWGKAQAQAGDAIDRIKTNINHVADKIQDEVDVYADKAEETLSPLADKTKSGFDKLRDTIKLG